jgi:hypothetical protein
MNNCLSLIRIKMKQKKRETRSYSDILSSTGPCCRWKYLIGVLGASTEHLLTFGWWSTKHLQSLAGVYGQSTKHTPYLCCFYRASTKHCHCLLIGGGRLSGYKSMYIYGELSNSGGFCWWSWGQPGAVDKSHYPVRSLNCLQNDGSREMSTETR